MKIVIHLIYISFLALVSLEGNSQSCYNYHTFKSCAGKPKGNFKVYGQSESALLEKDSTVTLPVVFYGNKDFIVTVCTERGYYPIHFLIRNVETNAVLYDNMEDDYIESVGFTIDHPEKVLFEITLLAENVVPSSFGEAQACVGVNIQWQRAAKTGF